jgi:hypothetical protein
MRASVNCCSSAPRRAPADDTEGRWLDEYFFGPYPTKISHTKYAAAAYSTLAFIDPLLTWDREKMWRRK